MFKLALIRFIFLNLTLLSGLVTHAVAGDWLINLPESSNAASGRLLLLLTPDTGDQPERLSISAVYPGDMKIAVHPNAQLLPGTTIQIDTETLAWPDGFSRLPAGKYYAQVWLDQDDIYNLDQGGAGDLFSGVTQITLPLQANLEFILDGEIPATSLWEFPGIPEPQLTILNAVRPRLMNVDIHSPLLSEFNGRDTSLRAWVLLPKDYDAQSTTTWPTAFSIGTFGATHKSNINTAAYFDNFDINNDPAMIWVFLDFWTPKGPSLFANSAVNGPWASALVEEFIPALEQRFRMDANPSGRLLTGHSSGGWSSAWLLAHYPALFGGAWATSPDPLDFTSFLQTNLTVEHANLYTHSNGDLRAVARANGDTVTTIKQTAQLEALLGFAGGIFQSWDQVFSPPATDGLPQQLFDRESGEINPEVAAYWHTNYDLSFYLKSHWETLAPQFNGKLHVIVGTEDDHFLEDSVYLLRDTLQELGAEASFTFLEGKNHNNLFSADDDPVALFRTIAREMYQSARP